MCVCVCVCVEKSEDLSSDHLLVVLIVNAQTATQKNPTQLINSKTNCTLFRQLLEEYIDLKVPLNNISQLDEEVEKLNVCIQKASWESIPQLQGKSQSRANYPSEVKELITKKRKNQKSWQRVWTP